MYDRVMAGWDVTVLLAGGADERPLQILGVETADLESALALWAERPHPQTVAVAADLFASDERVRRGVLGALEQGLTEVTLWGDSVPAELDDSVGPVQHHLSAAARAFKSQALDGRTRSRGHRRRYRDLPLWCDGDSVGRLRPRPRELSPRSQPTPPTSMTTLPTASPSATRRSARIVSARG